MYVYQQRSAYTGHIQCMDYFLSITKSLYFDDNLTTLPELVVVIGLSGGLGAGAGDFGGALCVERGDLGVGGASTTGVGSGGGSELTLGSGGDTWGGLGSFTGSRWRLFLR